MQPVPDDIEERKAKVMEEIIKNTVSSPKLQSLERNSSSAIRYATNKDKVHLNLFCFSMLTAN